MTTFGGVRPSSIGTCIRTRGSRKASLLLAVAAAATLAIGVAGCVLSAAPVIDDSKAIFDPALVGVWQPEDGSSRAVITQASETTYSVEYTEDGEVTLFEARMGELASRRVLDLWPTPGESDVSETYGLLLVEGHLLMIMDMRDDAFVMSVIDPDSLLAAIQRGQIEIPNNRSNERLILYGESKVLRDEIASYLEGGGALMEEEVWLRVED